MVTLPSPGRNAHRRAALVGAVLAATTACYRYTPATVAELQPGQSVRMELSAVAVDRVRRGPSAEARMLDGFNVSGKIAASGGDSLRLSVEQSVMDESARMRTLTRDLVLLRSEVQRVTLRRLDKKKTTWASVGLGAALVASAAFAIQRGGRSSGTIPEPPGPPEIRIPVSLAWLLR